MSSQSLVVDYYLGITSPWAYMGHRRLRDIARRTGATINVLPVDLGGKIFPVSGGLPVAKRAPQRLAYRLTELKRYSDYLGIPLKVQPTYFPLSSDDAAQLVIAVDRKDGIEQALDLAELIMKSLWTDDRNVDDPKVLAELLDVAGLPPERMDESHTQAVHEQYEADSQKAIEIGVFGSPTYVIEGELFWGQDRLDFVERRLRREHAASVDAASQQRPAT
ncbi:2-hydroxychromene-2-carboxylate isomerase [soil metagenome]